MSRFEEVIKEIDAGSNDIINMTKTGSFATMDQITSAAIATQLEIMNRSLAKLVDAITMDDILEEDKEDVDKA